MGRAFVAFEISRRHRFHRDIEDLPEARSFGPVPGARDAAREHWLVLNEDVEVRPHPGVPFDADPVGPVEVRYRTGSLSAQDEVAAGLLFHLRDDQGIGRVTFEGLDAIRAARGEHGPYAAEEPGRTWVHTVSGSAWLAERHEYEWTHYQTPLLDRYRHYLFRFHDDYVEAIAKGIWFDVVGNTRVWKLDAQHPGEPLDHLDPEWREVVLGIECTRRRNPRPLDELRADSRLCSQPLVQWNTILDGDDSILMTLRLREFDGVTRCSLTRRWAGEVDEWDEIPAESEQTAVLTRLCEGIASRRREMGK